MRKIVDDAEWDAFCKEHGIYRGPKPLMPDPDGDPETYSAWLRVAGPLAIAPVDDKTRPVKSAGGYGAAKVATAKDDQAFWEQVKERDREAFRQQEEDRKKHPENYYQPRLVGKRFRKATG